MMHSTNTSKSKVTLLALNASAAHEEYRAYPCVFVHRGRDYCNPYTQISKHSVARVMRAQVRMLAQGDAK